MPLNLPFHLHSQKKTLLDICSHEIHGKQNTWVITSDCDNHIPTHARWNGRVFTNYSIRSKKEKSQVKSTECKIKNEIQSP